MEGTPARRGAEPINMKAAMTQRVVSELATERSARAASEHLRSGKGAGDENFPVASRLIRRRHRPIILAFYEFVRVADDIADHPSLPAHEKLERLDRLESSLLDDGDDEPVGRKLGALLDSRGLSPRHAQDLLSAFRQDVTKLRYANWDELIDYCSRSAMPVGRFVRGLADHQPFTGLRGRLPRARSRLSSVGHASDASH